MLLDVRADVTGTRTENASATLGLRTLLQDDPAEQALPADFFAAWEGGVIVTATATAVVSTLTATATAGTGSPLLYGMPGTDWEGENFSASKVRALVVKNRPINLTPTLLVTLAGGQVIPVPPNGTVAITAPKGGDLGSAYDTITFSTNTGQSEALITCVCEIED